MGLWRERCARAAVLRLLYPLEGHADFLHGMEEKMGEVLYGGMLVVGLGSHSYCTLRVCALGVACTTTAPSLPDGKAFCS